MLKFQDQGTTTSKSILFKRKEESLKNSNKPKKKIPFLGQALTLKKGKENIILLFREQKSKAKQIFYQDQVSMIPILRPFPERQDILFTNTIKIKNIKMK